MNTMPFPRRLLNDYETITLDLHPHWWFLAPAGAATTVSGVMALTALAQFDGWLETLAIYLMIGALVVSAAWLVVKMVQWRTTYFVVTSHRVIYRQGVLARHGVEIPLERMSNVNFKQTIFERLIGSGDLIIESSGRAGQENFSDIQNPEEVQNIVHAALQNRDSRTEENYPRSDIATQLEKLEGLRQRGALSAEEFSEQKRRLLD
ncbi:MAG: PH domain-containing protein [Ilumatobacteraceae bacterium]|nr:PH domain-containing protein [Ilumatobacteraceae bacterium]